MANTSDAFRWMPESRVVEVCDLPRRSWRRWIADGVVAPPADGIYKEADVMTTAVLAALATVLGPGDAGAAWRRLQETGKSSRFVEAAQQLEPDGRFDLVVVPSRGLVRLAVDDRELGKLVREVAGDRPVRILDAARWLREVREAFDTRAERGVPPARRRGRPRKPVDEAAVHRLDDHRKRPA